MRVLSFFFIFLGLFYFVFVMFFLLLCLLLTEGCTFSLQVYARLYRIGLYFPFYMHDPPPHTHTQKQSRNQMRSLADVSV